MSGKQAVQNKKSLRNFLDFDQHLNIIFCVDVVIFLLQIGRMISPFFAIRKWFSQPSSAEKCSMEIKFHDILVFFISAQLAGSVKFHPFRTSNLKLVAQVESPLGNEKQEVSNNYFQINVCLSSLDTFTKCETAFRIIRM